MRKFFWKIILSIILVFGLIIVLSGFKYYFYPRIVFYNEITNFHNLIKERSEDEIMSKLAKRSNLRFAFEDDSLEFLYEEFDKFEDGYKIRNLYYGEVHRPNSSSYLGILVTLDRIAKIDKRPRTNFKVDLIKEGGNWKIGRYYFSHSRDY